MPTYLTIYINKRILTRETQPDEKQNKSWRTTQTPTIQRSNSSSNTTPSSAKVRPIMCLPRLSAMSLGARNRRNRLSSSRFMWMSLRRRRGRRGGRLMGSDFYLEYLNQKSVVRSYGCNVIVFLSLFSIFINRLFSRSVREYVHDYHLRLLCTLKHGPTDVDRADRTSRVPRRGDTLWLDVINIHLDFHSCAIFTLLTLL